MGEFEHNLTGLPLSSTDEKKRRAVNRDLLSLGKKDGEMKLEELRKASQLFDRFGDLYEKRDFSGLELEVDLSKYNSPGELTNLSSGLAFVHGNNASYYVEHFQSGQKNGQRGPEFRHVPGKIIDLNGEPCYRAMLPGRRDYTILVGNKEVDVEKYLEIGEPISLNGKLAYPAKVVDGKWVVVIDKQKEKIGFHVKRVNKIFELGGKLLIDAELTNGRRLVLYNGRVCSNVNDDEPISPYFLINNHLAYYALRGANLILITNNTETLSRRRCNSILWADRINGKNVYLRSFISDRSLIEDDEVIVDDTKYISDLLLPPVAMGKDLIIAMGEDRGHWVLANRSDQKIPIAFDEVYEIRALDESHCTVLGKYQNKFIKKVIDVSQLLNLDL